MPDTLIVNARIKQKRQFVPCAILQKTASYCLLRRSPKLVSIPVRDELSLVTLSTSSGCL